jgi:hypothetical protein
MSNLETQTRSDTGGASSSSVPHTREYFRAVNYGSWVSYVRGKGGYYDANGYLYYRGRLLTEADTEYIADWEIASKRLLTEEELRSAWLALLDVAGVSEA